jgi:hypothetical protein
MIFSFLLVEGTVTPDVADGVNAPDQVKSDQVSENVSIPRDEKVLSKAARQQWS